MVVSCEDARSLDVNYVDIERAGMFNVTSSAVLCEYALTVVVNDVACIRLACTPTAIRELVIGRLFTDGFISSPDEIDTFEWDEAGGMAFVHIPSLAPLSPASVPDCASSVASHSETLLLPEAPLTPYVAGPWDPETVFRMYDDFAQDTPLHALTAGTHSCRIAIDGQKVYQAEDIGRHNALDKAIGYILLSGIDPCRAVVFSSGRVPADMARKAIRAHIGVLATKAAPTDQAIELARRYGLVLVCTVKQTRLRVFSD